MNLNCDGKETFRHMQQVYKRIQSICIYNCIACISRTPLSTCISLARGFACIRRRRNRLKPRFPKTM